MRLVKDYIKTIIKLVLGYGVRKSFGQFGEDAFIQSLLKDKIGIYCDVGAYHPVLYSNTYGLYRAGWKGLVIDPNVSLRPLYTLLRPRDRFISVAIGQGGTRTYYMFSDGAYNTFDVQEAERCRMFRWLSLISTCPVQVRPLKEILKENNIQELGFLNIDVEGEELAVLESHNWSIRPEVIAVEDSNFNADAPEQSPVYTFLRSKDYVLRGFSGLTLIFTPEKHG